MVEKNKAGKHNLDADLPRIDAPLASEDATPRGSRDINVPRVDAIAPAMTDSTASAPDSSPHLTLPEIGLEADGEAEDKSEELGWSRSFQDEADRKRAAKRKRWFIVLIVALVVLVISLVALGAIAFSYYQGQQKYDEIAQTADVDFDSNGVGEDADLASLTVDWDALRKANPDTVAWVYMPDTPINYPVVQGEDNDHYLYYDFDGDAGWLAEYGAIFLDYHNKKTFIDPVNFIYGHHMNDGSMFAVISSFENQEEFDKHRIIYLLTPNGNYRLRSFSIVHCYPDDAIVETTFKRKADYKDYVQDKLDRSLVDPGDIPNASEMGRIFAFATCDSYSAGRDVMYTYVLDSTAEGLSGEIGLDSNDESTWFETDLKEE